MGAHLLARWDPQDAITLLTQVGATYDPNWTTLGADVTGVTEEKSDPRTEWSAALTLQTRY